MQDSSILSSNRIHRLLIQPVKPSKMMEVLSPRLKLSILKNMKHNTASYRIFHKSLFLYNIAEPTSSSLYDERAQYDVISTVYEKPCMKLQ